MTKPHEVLGSPAPVLFTVVDEQNIKILTLHICCECRSQCCGSRLYPPQIWMMFLQLLLHFLQQIALSGRLSSACSCMSARREPLHFSVSKINSKLCWRGQIIYNVMSSSQLTMSLTCFTCSNK